MPEFTYQADIRIFGTDEIQRGVWIDRSAKKLRVGDGFFKEDTSSYVVLEILSEGVLLVDYAAPEDIPPPLDETPNEPLLPDEPDLIA